MKIVLHIDFNSYFATVEQQANPHLRGKAIGVTGGDRPTRTVLSTASVEAKKLGVKTGMTINEAKKICPQIIIIPGDSDKYLSCSLKFWSILKDYTPYVEIFSIDEVFLELVSSQDPLNIAQDIKKRIKEEIGEWITVSIGISYNKLMAKLASSLQKPDGLVVIPNPDEAVKILDRVELDDICGIGPRIKRRLFQIGITSFNFLRKVPRELLLASFKSYGEVLYNMARGLDNAPIKPFFEKEEVKSIGHRHTLDHDTSDMEEIKQVLLKICEMVAVRLRKKKLVGKTIHCWYRSAFEIVNFQVRYLGDGKQKVRSYTCDGLEMFSTSWEIFQSIWDGKRIRMIGASISNLKPHNPHTLSFLPEEQRREKIIKALDNINNKFGDFTLQRGALLTSPKMRRKPNPYLADRRFKL